MTLTPGARAWLLEGLPVVKFRGRTYLFIGEWPKDGAIATEEQYASFSPSYAHLSADGKIRRYGKVIGALSDLESLTNEHTA